VIETRRRDRKRLRLAAGAVAQAIGVAALLCLSAMSDAQAEFLVVVEARGIASTTGSLIDSKSRLTLRQGEHVRLIGENGNQYCVDGPYDGPAKPPRTSSGGRSRLNPWNVGGRDQADPLTDCIR
jgi:hypothetical protein